MKYTEGRIIYVDPSRLCCDAIAIDGFNFFEDIQYADSGLKQTGNILHPEVGDVITVEFSEDGQAKLHRYYSQRTRDNNNLTQFKAGLGGVLNINNIIPGDRTITGPDGSWLNLLRGRLASIGSTPLCQTVYVGLEGLIRTVCQNYDAIGSGFRIFSVNSGEAGITTRLCFSGTDQFLANAVQTNADALSENYEYQIDITSSGMTFFIGNIDPDSGKRVNNLVITLSPTGDVNYQVGQNIQGALYSNGGMSFYILDNSNNILYNKSISTTSDFSKIFMKEIIKGDVVREIDGNLSELITGTHTSNKDTEVSVVNTKDATITINKASIGLNVKDLSVTYNPGLPQ